MALILVTDDDRSLHSTVRLALESIGHRVLLAMDGHEGARLWRRHGADMVLLDLYMAGADGIETLLHLRAMAPGLPVVMMSGGVLTGRLDLLADASMLGASFALAKPFCRSQLLEVASQCLGTTDRSSSGDFSA